MKNLKRNLLLLTFFLLTIFLMANDNYIKSPTYKNSNKNLTIIVNKDDIKIYDLKNDSILLNLSSNTPILDSSKFTSNGCTDCISIFGILITVVILAFSIISLLWQYHFSRNFRQDLHDESERVSRRFEAFRDSSLSEYDRKYQELNTKFGEQFNNFISSSNQTLYKNTLDLFSEANQTSAEVRDILYSIMNNSGQLISSEIIPPDKRERFSKLFFDMILSWHILGQITSNEKEEMIKGLSTFATNPFKEMKSYLVVLQKRHEGDHRLHLAISQALASIK